MSSTKTKNKSKKGGREKPMRKSSVWPTLKDILPKPQQETISFENFKTNITLESFDKLHPDQQYAILFYMIASSCTPQPLTKLKKFKFITVNNVETVEITNVSEEITNEADIKQLTDLQIIINNIQDLQSIKTRLISLTQKFTNLKTETIKYLLSDEPDAPLLLQKLQQIHYDEFVGKNQEKIAKKFTNYDLLDLRFAIMDLFPSETVVFDPFFGDFNEVKEP